MKDSKERFTDRVSNYVKYRPFYPDAFIEYLKTAGVCWPKTAADIGAGTGILTRRLLLLGTQVYAVEPNGAMRSACLEHCAGFNNFEAVNGSAENTALPDESVDYITVAQAFHWFDKEAAKKEFRRILKPGGRVILVWNVRDIKSTPFMAAYEGFLTEYMDESALARKRADYEYDESLRDFFECGFEKREFGNLQRFDYRGLEGRALSSSYTPMPGDPRFDGFIERLRDLFSRYQSDGTVDFLYNTVSYTGEV